MSFDLIRRHRRKVEVPLAIFVVITFVFWGFGTDIVEILTGKSLGGGRLNDQLAALGQELCRAGYIGEPRFNWNDSDDDKLDDKKRRERERQRQQAILEEFARRAAPTYLSALAAEELGVQISDEEVTAEIEQQLPRWGLERPFDETRFRKALLGRGLSDAGYRALIGQRMLAERGGALLEMSAGASESERFDFYCRTRQKVRVQYFQRRAEDFVAEVEEASKKEAAASAAPAKPEDKDKDKEKDKPARKGVSDDDVRQRYEAEVEAIKERQDKDAGEWHDQDLANLPEYFSLERAAVECLMAPKKDFLKTQVVTDMEVDKYYQDNKDHEFLKEPRIQAADAPGEPPPPVYKMLDDNLRAEIRTKLADRKALSAAEARVKAAAEEYEKAPADKKPALGDLAKAHGLLSFALGPAEREELEAAKFLAGASPGVGDAFYPAQRKEMTAKFSAPMRMKDDDGALAIRVTGFQPRAILALDQARAGVRRRLVLEKALDLAKTAIDEDKKALEAGKLDPKRVRVSDLIANNPFGRADETWDQVATLALGEAAGPYKYRNLLGAEAEAARKAEGDDKKKKKDVMTAMADSMFRGWRVVILDERQMPTVDEFRNDRMSSFSWQQAASLWPADSVYGWHVEKARRLGIELPWTDFRTYWLYNWVYRGMF